MAIMVGVDVSVLFLMIFGMTTLQTSASPATYRVTFGSRVRAGMQLPVSVQLVRGGDFADVFIVLRNNVTKAVVASAQQQRVYGGGRPEVINLMIPRELNQGSGYEIRVRAIGAINFDESADITVERKSFSILVQTDKAVYKPGQTVMIRILAMNPDLSVHFAPMDVFIKDPEGNLMRQWKQVEEVNTGVVELSMPTSSNPPLGNWTVQVTILGLNETQTFLIDKYVLPKFETNVQVPLKVLSSHGINGTASARYTFGKTLTAATVTVAVRLQTDGSRPNITSTGKLDAEGKFRFAFTNGQLLALAGKTFSVRSLDNVKVEVIVKVKDDYTGNSANTTAVVVFEKYQAKVEFLPITTNSFKPGLQYSAYLSVTKYDGSMFSGSESISMTFDITTTTSRYSTNRVLNLTENGFIRIDETFPKDAERISIKAQVGDFSTAKVLDKAYSPSGNFLQVVMNSERPLVGSLVRFTAFITERITQISYQVYAKGAMVYESSAESTSQRGDDQFSISFSLQDVMAPNTRLLVFYFRPDGELVADSLSFKVEGSSNNPINLRYSADKVKTGSDVSLIIKAEPDSSVFLLAVDKSVQLLKSGNDITQEKITRERVFYDYGDAYLEFWKDVVVSNWPYSVKGSDVKSIFKDTQVIILTDGTVSQKPPVIIPTGPKSTSVAARLITAIPYFIKPLEYRLAFISSRAVSHSVSNAALAHSERIPDFELRKVEPEEKVERIRTFFPERWLWSLVTIGSSGVVTKQVTTPDTVTTWLTTAFAVHPLYGVSVTQQAAELTTFQNLFLSLDLPYSVIRGEDICLRTFAFNYYNRPLQMRVTLGQADGLDNIVLEPASGAAGQRETRRPVSVTQDLGLVDSNAVEEADFCVTPTKIGTLPIRVNLTSSVPGDGVVYMLPVEPEGSPMVNTISVRLDARPNVLFSKTVPLNFPSTAVQGSKVISVKVSGDLLAPVIANLENLLRLPDGCGEQNMVHFAPDVFLVNYLQRTNTYTLDLKTKAENFMLIGYQKQISYRRTDGSFSTWGNSDGSGSMWLTAFVTKCFAQAMALTRSITIDPNVVKSSIQWMKIRQNGDGSFPEPGHIVHTDWQSGSAQGESLTAFVLISLAEASDKAKSLTPEEQQSLQTSITRAREYLERQLNALSDPYDLAIVTYALHLPAVVSGSRDVAFARLKETAITNDKGMHWERRQDTPALNIEMTSYSLLTYILRRDVQGGMPILRWLLDVRGADGGFISTQDTVVALQALAEMAIANHNPIVVPFTVTVSWRSGGQTYSKQLTIDDSTKLLLQTVDVTVVNGDIPTEVQISASTSGTFTGFPEAQVVMEYNDNTTTNSQVFHITYQILNPTKNTFTLVVEARRVDNQRGGMTVLEVGIPTGFSIDPSDPEYSVLNSRLQEQSYRKYILYYDEVYAGGIRTVLPMSVSQGIPVNTQPVPIKIYTYYEPGGRQQLTVYYQLSDSRARVYDRMGISRAVTSG